MKSLTKPPDISITQGFSLQMAETHSHLHRKKINLPRESQESYPAKPRKLGVRLCRNMCIESLLGPRCSQALEK